MIIALLAMGCKKEASQSPQNSSGGTEVEQPGAANSGSGASGSASQPRPGGGSSVSETYKNGQYIMTVIGPHKTSEPIKVHVEKNDAVTVGMFSYGDNVQRKLRIFRDKKPWSDPLAKTDRTVKFHLSEPGDYELYAYEITKDESKANLFDSTRSPMVQNSYQDGGAQMAFLGYSDFHYHEPQHRGLMVIIMDSDFDRMLPGTVATIVPIVKKQ